jgi:hypothetical protein
MTLSSRVAAALLVPLLLSGGALLSPVAAQEASPSPSPSGPPPVQVTNADSGRTVSLVPGQELVVELMPPSAGEQWQGPDSTDGLYLVAYDEREARTRATLQALRSSTDPIVLHARTDRACRHDESPCAQSLSEWTLAVTVSSGSTHDPSYRCWSMPTPSILPGNAFITAADNGKRFTVELGKLAAVQLGGCEDPYVVPTATGALFPQSHSYLANGNNQSHFRALRLGTSTITSFTDPACFHTQFPCARPTARWSVEVEVVPATDDACRLPPSVALDRSTVVATGEATVTVTGARSAVVDLYAYTQPSTTYRLVRSGTTSADGVVSWAVRAPANTRLYAQQRDCAPGPSVVLNVATALTLTAERKGVREYVFAGDSLPARSGGLIVSLYRITNGGGQILTSQARASAVDGEWRLERRFTGTGRFGFVARTGQDMRNAPGASQVRSLLVH